MFEVIPFPNKNKNDKNHPQTAILAAQSEEEKEKREKMCLAASPTHSYFPDNFSPPPLFRGKKKNNFFCLFLTLILLDDAEGERGRVELACEKKRGM